MYAIPINVITMPAVNPQVRTHNKITAYYVVQMGLG